MKTTDFSLDQSNRFLSQAVSKEELNFCSYITTGLKHNISVIAKYSPTALFDGFVTLDENLRTVYVDNFTDYYYGISPKVDSALIIDSISKLRFSDLDGIDKFISEHSDCFMLHPSQEDSLLNLARYLIIAYSSNYGIKVHASPECLEISKAADPAGRIIVKSDNILSFRGCPTQKILDAFSTLRFVKGDDSIWEISSDDGIGIDQIYKNPDNIVLLNGSTFYSGVLLKPLVLSYQKNYYENYNTATLRIDFERSTYATVFAMDGNFLYHPLLDCCKNAISGILYHDDICKFRMVDALKKQQASGINAEDLLATINEYLKTSVNVNQIGVSGNIVTSDNILLLGKRSGDSIDSGFLYPSTNGNAEVADQNVSFYSYSVYADAPSISLDESRIDFHGEITREAYAELHQEICREDWICYGVTISGNVSHGIPNPETLYSNKSRRLHFNVLFEQQVAASFSDVCKNARFAVESFENEKILGVEVRTYKNFADYAMKLVSQFFEQIAESKDLIESVLLLILFFNSILRHHEIISGDVTSRISLVLALIIVAVTLYRCCSALLEKNKRMHQIRRLLIFRNNSYEVMQEKILRIISDYRCHPVAFAALQLYIENRVFDELSGEE